MNRTPRDNVRTSIFLPAKLHERIQNVADVNKTSTSRVIRYILGEYFKNIQHKQEGISSEKMDELIRKDKDSNRSRVILCCAHVFP